MSAYLKDEIDFVRLAQFFKGWRAYNMYQKKRILPERIDPDDAVERHAAIMAQANIDSVNYRYDESEPHQEEEFVQRVEAMAAVHNGMPLSNAEAWQLASSIEYQSCERPDWIQSDAYWILQYAKDKAAMGMVR